MEKPPIYRGCLSAKGTPACPPYGGSAIGRIQPAEKINPPIVPRSPDHFYGKSRTKHADHPDLWQSPDLQRAPEQFRSIPAYIPEKEKKEDTIPFHHDLFPVSYHQIKSHLRNCCNSQTAPTALPEKSNLPPAASPE